MLASWSGGKNIRTANIYLYKSCILSTLVGKWNKYWMKVNAHFVAIKDGTRKKGIHGPMSPWKEDLAAWELISVRWPGDTRDTMCPQSKTKTNNNTNPRGGSCACWLAYPPLRNSRLPLKSINFTFYAKQWISHNFDLGTILVWISSVLPLFASWRMKVWRYIMEKWYINYINILRSTIQRMNAVALGTFFLGR